MADCPRIWTRDDQEQIQQVPRACLEPGTAGLWGHCADHSAMLPPVFPFMIVNKLRQIKIKFTNYFYPWQLIFSKQTCLIASPTLRLFHHAAPMRVPIFGLKNYCYNVCAAQQEGMLFASVTLEEGKNTTLHLRKWGSYIYLLDSTAKGWFFTGLPVGGQS